MSQVPLGRSPAHALSSTMAANGVVPSQARREAEFYEQLLRIRDQVFASKHPRIQLPPKVLEQVAPRPPKYSPPSSRPTINGTPNGSKTRKPVPSLPEISPQHHSSTNEFVSPAQTAQRPFSAKSISSGIDPVLLTKSDHLIRAELQLRRQQIERTLKDQLDKKGRFNDPLIEDRETRVDVEGILTKAHEQVKPLSGLQIAAANSDRAESFDENSYYSSKANSWSSEEPDPKQTANGIDATEPLLLQAKRSAIEAQLTVAKHVSPFYRKPKQVEPTVIDLDEEPYEPADNIEIYEPEPALAHDEAGESDYSPPPANVAPNGSSRRLGRERGFANNGSANGSTRLHSPVGNPAPIQNMRKRRRDEKRDEKRRQQAHKRVVRSPEPYIKEEPQSPPPFAAYPDSQPSKRRALPPLPSDVEIVSALEGRAHPVYYKEQEQAARIFRPYDEPSSPTVIRTPVPRRPERDEQDLRRVASLQYARRPYSPVGPEPFPPPEIRQARAASHAFVDRPLEQPIYREASVRLSAAPRYVRERTRSPVYEYLPRAQSPISMAPPSRRIVVDQDGNRYYAAPVSARESVVPPSRRMDPEPYYERAIPRDPTMRAPARPELYEEDDIQRMPPPSLRRYMEASEVEVADNRPFRHREPSHRPMEVEYRPQEIMERRPGMQYEEMGPPREYVPSRAYSVRPEVVRREVCADYAPVRHESVQPGFVRVAAPRYREVSVVQQDLYDDRQYAVPPQGRRYIEEGAERPVEVAHEPHAGEPRRVSYRF